MKVFVISLERALDRRQYMHNQLKKLNIDYEIINAVDYQKLSENDFQTLCHETAISEGSYLNKGLLACSLSHVKVLQRIISDNLDMALIIEDDAELPSNIDSILVELKKEIRKDEVIALSYYSHSGDPTYLSNHNKKVLSNNFQLLLPVNLKDIASTMAYVVTKEVAEEMTKAIMPVSVAPDNWGVYYERGAFDSFRCLYPTPVRVAPFRTTLDYAAAKSFKSKISSFVRKYRIPFLLPYLEKRSNAILSKKYTFYLTDDLPFNSK
jgi:glycosyl transferase, family 25